MDRLVVETFLVEESISLLGAQREEKILGIELVGSLDATSPSVINKNLVTNR
jgi:hypothetical protein